MSSSPIPKKGSFSNLVNAISSHRRTTSFKSIKTGASKAIEILQEPSNDETSKIKSLEKALKSARDELIHQKSKNRFLKKKLKVLQSKNFETLNESSIDIQTKIKNIYTTQCESLKLIDFLFETLEKTYSSKSIITEDVEVNLIQSFQQFQNRTQIDTRKYIKNVMA